MSFDAKKSLVGGFAEVLKPLTVDDPGVKKEILELLGLPGDAPPAGPLVSDEVLERIRRYRDSQDPDEHAYEVAAQSVREIATILADLYRTVGAGSVAGGILEGVHHAISVLTTEYFKHNHFFYYGLFKMLGFIEEHIAAHSPERLTGDRVARVVSDAWRGLSFNVEDEPEARSVTDRWGHALSLIFVILFKKDKKLAPVRVHYGWESSRHSLSTDADYLTQRVLTLVFNQDDPDREYRVSLLLVPARPAFTTTRSEPDFGDVAPAGGITTVHTSTQSPRVGPGFILHVAKSVSFNLETETGWTLGLDVTGGVPVFIRTRFQSLSQPRLLGNGVGVGLSLSLERTFSEEDCLSIGGPVRLEVRQLGAHVTLHSDSRRLAFSLEARDNRFVLDPRDPDGFLGKILPRNGFMLPFRVALGWEPGKGFFFDPSLGELGAMPPIPSAPAPPPEAAGVSFAETDGAEESPGTSADIGAQDGGRTSGDSPLSIPFTMGKSIGPLRIRTLEVALGPSPGEDSKGARLEVLTSFDLTLGPIEATVDRIGFVSGVSVASVTEGFGNLGLLNMDMGFRPPTGIGLKIKSSIIEGGGYLSFDPEKGEYAGVADVKIGKGLGLTLIGLLNTRMPDGTKGYSFLLSGSLQLDPGIPLFLGFTLSGAGLIVGVHRTLDVAVLRAGVRQGIIGDLLSPPNPLQNPALAVRRLSSLFPAKEGSHVVGLSARLDWRQKVFIDLGLVYDTSAPLRITSLSKIQIKLGDVVHIQLACAGVLDIAEKELTFQATLFDSKVGRLELTGDAAMVLRWGSKPAFALAIGGFHPGFRGPELGEPIFRGLSRLAVKLPSTEWLRVTWQGYFAVTPNSLQIGAKLDIFAAIGDLTIEGGYRFDALVEFVPFHLLLDVEGRVTVKYDGYTLLAASLTGQISGPAPSWRVRGTVTVTILLLDIKRSFDHTFGHASHQALPAPVNVRDALVAELRGRDSWSSDDSGGPAPVELSVRGGAAQGIVLSPFRPVRVTQGRVPLGILVERIGDAKAAGSPVNLDITEVTIQDVIITQPPAVYDRFSRAQYQYLTPEEILGEPPFRKMKSGVLIDATHSVTAPAAATVASVTLAPRQIILGAPETSLAAGEISAARVELTEAHLSAHVANSAAARRRTQATGPDRYRTSDNRRLVVNEEPYAEGGQ